MNATRTEAEMIRSQSSAMLIGFIEGTLRAASEPSVPDALARLEELYRRHGHASAEAVAS